ncbi:MAG: alpha-L-fucosidase [Armatimonadetes bacterium]|nr:alpha-L-fucosidase [Armatimonadota bacterium]
MLSMFWKRLLWAALAVHLLWPQAEAQYEGQALRFDPSDFDAGWLARLARESGMKHLVITTKRHDGFCMWDTRLTDYSIMYGPLKRDLIREIAETCRKRNLRVGFYCSLCDWRAAEMAAMIRSLQPQIIMNDRLPGACPIAPPRSSSSRQTPPPIPGNPA